MGSGEVTNAASLPMRVLRYGKDEPLPERRVVRAGPLTAVLENADLRYVKLGDRELVRRVYMAVRDRNWNTIEPRFTSYEFQADHDSFRVRFAAEHVREPDLNFAWDGTIEGTPNGVITVTLDGAARKSFYRNRIGFCVLHPMAMAETSVVVETPDGRVDGAFPTRISPHQPFMDMRSIAYPASDDAATTLTILFEGDLFEMEDQRNWTDASYKTYCTPLRLPYPVLIEEGERVRQSVTIDATGAKTLTVAPEEAPIRVEVGTTSVGVLPPIGLGTASHGKPLSEAEIAKLKGLRPAHLRIELDVTDDCWRERLHQAAEEAQALAAALELEVVAGDDGEGLDELVEALRRVEPKVARLLVFPTSSPTTTEPVARRARSAVAAAGLAISVGGGTRAYFTEFNRATLPLDDLDQACYAINPQVHAFDNLSLIETLAAQAETVASARAIVGDLPLAIGPITLRPRFNPNATGPAPEPRPDELPPAVDPRQISLFAAAWTVGSIRRLAEADVASLTYYQTTGWRGVVERCDGTHRADLFPWRPGALFPLYHVLADANEFAGANLLPVTTSAPLSVEALALRDGDRLRVLVAGFGEDESEVSVTLPAIVDARVRYLDETNAEAAMADRSALTASAETLGSETTTEVALRLRPFAVACIDGRIE